jgi:uncharacterized membrane protein
MYIRFRSRSRMSPVAGMIIVVVVSLVFITIGVFLLKSNIELANNGIKTEASVIDYRRDMSGKSVIYKPVVEFTLTNGETFQTISDTGSSGRPYNIGQKIGIIYMEDDPDNFVIDSFFQVYGFPGIFAFAGILVLVLAIYGVIKKRQTKTEPDMGSDTAQ